MYFVTVMFSAHRSTVPSNIASTTEGRRTGSLIAFYRAVGRPSHAELRIVHEAASLVAAQVELSIVAEQEERLVAAGHGDEDNSVLARIAKGEVS